VRKTGKANEEPRRRGAVAIEDTNERGLAMRLLLHSPKDLVAAMFASAAVIAIISNAMFMQAGRHPSPMFGGSDTQSPTTVANPLPRPRPVEALARPDSKPAEPKLAEPRAAEIRPQDSRPVDPPANLLRPTPTPAAPPVPTAPATTNVARPPAPIPAHPRDPVGDLITASRRVASVQRALTEYGYGQLKPTGTVGSDTQAAIQRFERDRKIPVTGQMSDRLVRELSTMIGRPID
jgi:hypothetical protein